MKKFETISDYQILQYAYDCLVARIFVEEECLKDSPNSEITKNCLERYKAKFEEICTEILRLELLPLKELE